MGPEPGTMVDIGRFSGRTLLTGAGWSRNWGGKLASEVWQDLIGHRLIRKNPRLHALLLQEQAFEEAFAATQSDAFTETDRTEFQQAMLDVFAGMDREIGRHDHDPWINIYKVQQLVFRFWSGTGGSVDSGYVFTLNQDLWLERHLFNEMSNGAPRPTLPGLRGQPNQQFFSSVMDIGSNDLTMHPVAEPASTVVRGNLNIIKLHGSFNWRTADARSAVVIGTEKSNQIAASPLLSWYFDIFRSVISAGSVRLMIVGYGFGDAHVNAAIANAIQDHDLKIFIWDTGHDLKGRVRAAPHGERLWSGLISAASRSMIEVFPSNQATTEEYCRIIETFFD